jgi:hypothetical protein
MRLGAKNRTADQFRRTEPDLQGRYPPILLGERIGNKAGRF